MKTFLLCILLSLTLIVAVQVVRQLADCPPCEPVLWIDEKSGELHWHWDGGDLK